METKTVNCGVVHETSSNFGKYGWSMILYSLILYFLWAGFTTDGLNIFPGVFAGTHSWDQAMLLAYATPAGIIGVLGSLIFGQLIIKFKPRKLSAFCLVMTGVSAILFGRVTTPAAYGVFLTLISFFATGFGLNVTSTLMSNWFPRKKGIALGWATMGAPLCTAAFIPLLALMFHLFGLQDTWLYLGIGLIVIGLVSLVWVKDTPEEAGCYPDNIPTNQDELKISMEEMKNYKSPFTIIRLLADKDMWLVSLGFGMLWLVTVGIVSQFIPRMISVGYSQQQAITMLTISAIIAIPGSYFWGWLDQKYGTKLASSIYSMSYILCLILLLSGIQMLAWLACLFVGLGLGGLLNLMPSMVIRLYGRYDFMAVNRLVSPIASIVRIMAFAIMAALLMASGGSYTIPYLVFIGLDVVGLVLLLILPDTCKGKV